MGNLWLFAEKKKVAAQPHPPTNQVQTCIFQIPLGEDLKWYMSAKIPEGREGFTLWPTDYDVRISDDLIWEDRQKEIMKQAYDEGKKPRWGSI